MFYVLIVLYSWFHRLMISDTTGRLCLHYSAGLLLVLVATSRFFSLPQVYSILLMSQITSSPLLPQANSFFSVPQGDSFLQAPKPVLSSRSLGPIVFTWRYKPI